MKDFSAKNGFNIEQVLPHDIQEDLSLVEDKLKAVLPSEPPIFEKIGKHVLDSGGKRLRPILNLLSASFCDSRGPDAVEIAATTELIHTATLLHDDVIDSSLTRRGKPSANVLWGNKSSILVGDFLFSQCISALVNINNPKILRAFSDVFNELSIGEMLELVNEHNLRISLDSYFEIIKKKTSSLFKLCMQTGALLNSHSGNLNGALAECGTNFGIMFQLVDDYLDYFGDAEKMGKPTMGDFKEKKVTFPLIHLKKLCNPKELDNLSEIFYQFKINETEELYIKGLMEKYRIDSIILDLAKGYNSKAYENLRDIKDSSYKNSLFSIMEYNLTRDR